MIIDYPEKDGFLKLRSLWKEAFGDTDDFLNAFETTAFCDKRCRVVTDKEKAVSALYWFDCSLDNRRLAYIYAVATAKAYRGKGICRLLMQDTHNLLKTLGYDGVILVPGSSSLFDFYERMGYRVCSFVQEFQCSASQSKTEVALIDEKEFATLRRRFLKDGGVVQEKENLRFLKTMANFYTGNGFLLAARQEGDTLYGIELLGDTQAAPDIVRAFGCKEGRFRTKGTDKPFAMYYPLKEDAVLPEYFGLAFD